MFRSKRLVGVALVVAALGLACGGGLEDGSHEEEPLDLGEQDQALILRHVMSNAPFTVFADPYGDGSSNPAAGIRGQAGASFTTRETYTGIRVSNLPPRRTFGAHVHKLSCADTKGGTHYQNIPSPTTPTDVAYANANNEIWLDFTTDRNGRAQVSQRSNFVIRRNQANSIVVHTQATGEGGIAGAKLACIDLDF
jgi:hypothetical protein